MYAVSIGSERFMLPFMAQNSLATLILNRVKELGISQRAYADRMGLSASHMNGLVHGKIQLPRPELRRRLAHDLGLTHLDLLVMAGEINADEIPVEGAPRDLFPSGSIHAEVVKELTGMTEDLALQLASFAKWLNNPPEVDVPVVISNSARR